MVHLAYDPKVITFDEILKVFFENHDPTQGNRQGNDMGPQYRSAIFTYNDELRGLFWRGCRHPMLGQGRDVGIFGNAGNFIALEI